MMSRGFFERRRMKQGRGTTPPKTTLKNLFGDHGELLLENFEHRVAGVLAELDELDVALVD